MTHIFIGFRIAMFVAALVVTRATSTDQQKPVVSKGSVVVVNTDTLVCRKWEDGERLAAFARDHDQTAFDQLLKELGVNCIFLKPGELVTVVDYDSWRQTYCVRRVGDPTCYWIEREAVTAH